MPIWLQHSLVLMLVAGCVAVVVRQAIQTLSKGTGRLGACCARGCGAADPTKPSPAVLIPVESLGRPKSR